MIRPCVALVALFAVSACDENKKPPITVTRERSQAIIGTSPAPEPQSLTTAAADAPKVVGEKLGGIKPPRRLCNGALASKGSELSGEPMARRAAEGERELPEKMTFSTQYTWINFWAAWCVPCKEEIPRLLDWEKRLTAAGVGFKVMFVSLDDDERQLTAFLGKQPTTGLRRSYWLDDGAPRTDWLAKVGMKPDMELPAHLLVDASAKVRCKIQGAIEDSDYSQLLGLLNGSR